MQEPLYVLALIQKGVSLSKLDRDPEALEYYDLALRLAPHSPHGQDPGKQCHYAGLVAMPRQWNALTARYRKSRVTPLPGPKKDTPVQAWGRHEQAMRCLMNL